MVVRLLLAAALTMSADFGKPAGRIRRELHCSGFGPQICFFPRQCSEELKSFGMLRARTHDWGLVNFGERVCDNHMIFPLEGKDPRDPSNYYFKATDFVLKRTREEVGSEIFFRLGTSIEHAYYGGRFNCNVPKDFDAVAENFAATVRHYNRGWAEGFNWDIRYWEIWNEPDGITNMWWLPDDDARFAGAPAPGKAREAARAAKCRELFVKFYVTVLKRLKDEFGDTIKVGGPALCSCDEEYFRVLFDACKAAGVAPDFISWHHYMENCDDAVDAVARARRLCDGYGFENCELIIDEWHYFGYSRYNWGDLWSGDPRSAGKVWEGPASHNGIDSSAFLVSTVSRFHDTALDAAYYYGCRTVGMWGYMDETGRRYKVYGALKLLGDFMTAYTDRFEATGVDPRGAPIATVLAGKSADGRRSALLVADYRVPTREIAIDVKGVPAGGKVKATVLDSAHDLAPADFAFADGRLSLRKDDESSAVFLIEFE